MSSNYSKGAKQGWKNKRRREKKLKELNAALPFNTDYESKSFRIQQKAWYIKLKKKGFDDIEWNSYEKQSGNKSQNSGFLKHSSPYLTEADSEARDLYYSCCSNWLVHSGPAAAKDRALFELHSTGETLSEILRNKKLLSKFHKKTRTHIDARLKAMQLECKNWNAENELGILKSRELEARMIENYFENALNAGKRLYPLAADSQIETDVKNPNDIDRSVSNKTLKKK